MVTNENIRKAFTTFEIGSLAKPAWRTKPFAKVMIDDNDVDDAKKWGKFLNVENEELLSILNKRKNFSSEEKTKILYFSSLYAIKLLEKAGLDWVFDGEQHRVEMYQYPIKFCNGFKLIGEVRSFDNKYYKKATITGPVSLKAIYHINEFLTIKNITKRKIKVPITGPYTISDWSYDEYYTINNAIGSETSMRNVQKGRKKLLEDISFNVIRRNIEALIKNGAEWIQIDEPALTTHRDEVLLAVDIINKMISNLKCIFSIHICFSDYEALFPHIEKLQNHVKLFALEFANRDKNILGVKQEVRIGYDILKEFKRYNFDIGLGVLNIHTDFIEPPELIRDRILYACKLLGDPSRIYVTPDCGLRTRSWKVAYKKLANMVEGVYLASKLF